MNMSCNRSFLRTVLAGALVAMLLVPLGCASGPHYGASRKKSKSCDCPHWNKVTKPSNAVWSRAGQQGTRDEARN